jgi:hypothetical protein
MKNKKLIYLMLTLAVIVWGIVIWKVYPMVSGAGPQPVHEPGGPAPEVKPDTFELLLNYRDPFFEQPQPSGEKKNNVSAVYEEDAKSPDFIYKGMITAGKKTFGVICRNSEEILITRGDRIEDFIIVKYDAEELVARRKGNTYNLSIE